MLGADEHECVLAACDMEALVSLVRMRVCKLWNALLLARLAPHRAALSELRRHYRLFALPTPATATDADAPWLLRLARTRCDEIVVHRVFRNAEAVGALLALDAPVHGLQLCGPSAGSLTSTADAETLRVLLARVPCARSLTRLCVSNCAAMDLTLVDQVVAAVVPRVRSLSLMVCRLGSAGAGADAPSCPRTTFALAFGVAPQLVNLALAHCKIDDACADALCGALAQRAVHLAVLDLRNNRIGVLACAPMARLLAARPRLCGLRLVSNALFAAGEMAALDGVRGVGDDAVKRRLRHIGHALSSAGAVVVVRRDGEALASYACRFGPRLAHGAVPALVDV